MDTALIIIDVQRLLCEGRWACEDADAVIASHTISATLLAEVAQAQALDVRGHGDLEQRDLQE